MRRNQRRPVALILLIILFIVVHIYHRKTDEVKDNPNESRGLIPKASSDTSFHCDTTFIHRHYCELVKSEEAVKTMWNFAQFASLFRDLSLKKQSWLCESFSNSPNASFIDILQNTLFPWLSSSAKDLQSSFKPGRVIVYTTARHHAHYVLLSTRTLRYLRCTLPILVLYKDDEELPSFYRTALESVENVSTQPIGHLMHWGKADPRGWAIKPFVMLYAPYQEVLFIDSDVYFLRSPEELFEDPEYKSQGSLFFHDRSLFPDASSPSHAWFKTFVPSPSAQGQQLRHWKTESQHEQESGVVVIHKGTDAFYGLLTTCAMNASPRRDEVYGKVYGDKETFWMGFEAARVPYAFMPVFGSVIGFRSGDYVCGGLLHVNREKKPLWFNNGVQVDKSSQPNRLIELQLYSLDTNTNVGWLFGNNSPDGYCMKGGAVFKLSDQDIITGQWILNSFRKLRENTTMHDLWDGK